MRLEGQKLMGYFPTPDNVTSRIRSFLHFPSGQASLFDPCCGEGIALEELASQGNAVTYGIELDCARAEEAKKRLAYVICGDYRQSKVSHGAFSLLWLNPPYDSDEGERKESIFLRDTTRYLQDNGVLVYIIPRHRLDERIAKLISLQFENIGVFQFPPEEYQKFKQIVVLAVKKTKTEPDTTILQAILHVSEKELPELPTDCVPIYRMPETKPVAIFQSNVVDMLALQDSLQKSPLWGRLDSLVSCKNSENSSRPPLPLRAGHIALVLASGFLDGEVGEKENLHIVKGRVFKETKKTTEVLEKEIVHKETDVIRISIKILLPDGQIKVLV